MLDDGKTASTIFSVTTRIGHFAMTAPGSVWPINTKARRARQEHLQRVRTSRRPNENKTAA
ncbi:MAG: hypothetical protein CTY36_17720 [Methylocystis sp.]|nr:MAG: hypothetical protein CTY36_17720 [Methylocystis sp.]